MTGERISFVGILHTTPRVGQNAVLRALRSVFPGADEWGAARPDHGRLVCAINRPPPGNAWDHLDVSGARWGAPVFMRRMDMVDQAISWTVASQTGRFRSDVPARGIPEYDHDGILAAMATIRDQEARWANHFAETGEKPLEIWYEADVRDDPRVAARAILDWWDVSGEPCVPDLERVESDVKREWRRRWDESQGH